MRRIPIVVVILITVVSILAVQLIPNASSSIACADGITDVTSEPVVVKDTAEPSTDAPASTSLPTTKENVEPTSVSPASTSLPATKENAEPTNVSPPIVPSATNAPVVASPTAQTAASTAAIQPAGIVAPLCYSKTNTPVPTNTFNPPTATVLPPTATSLPPTETALPPTETALPPTETALPPTETALPPTETALPPTETALPPTATALPPTATALPPTETALPPTETALPPTETALPPTETALPPTETALPPTATALPPTATALPPTESNTAVTTVTLVPSTMQAPKSSAACCSEWLTATDGTDIFLVPKQGGTPRNLTVKLGGLNDSPSIGPNYVVFVHRVGSTSHLWIIAWDATGARELSTMQVSTPRAQPCGDWILFVSENAAKKELYAIRRDGSGLTKLSDNQQVHEPSWSLDGSYITWIEADGNVMTAHFAATQGRVNLSDVMDTVNASGISNTRYGSDASWMIYINQNQIHRVNRDGTNDVVIVQGNSGTVSAAVVGIDGLVAYQLTVGHRSTIHAYFNGKDWQVSPDDGLSYSLPTLDCTGIWLVAVQSGDAVHLVRMYAHQANTQVVRLTRVPLSCPALMPDFSADTCPKQG